MHTVSSHWPKRAPRDDRLAVCDICGSVWRQSLMRRDGDGLLVCPSDYGPSATELTEANIARGKVYYQYYCIFCHAANGDGNATVGQSLVPVPGDLRSPKVQAYSDGELLRAMLTGPGHKPFAPYAGSTPVLEYTVLPEHRWYMVLFVRSLSLASPPTRAEERP